MIASFFPLKKMRRNGKYLLFGAILVVGVVAVYHEMVAAKAWSGHTDMSPETGGGGSWRGTKIDAKVGRDHQLDPVEDTTAWSSRYTPQIWKPEYKGRANLHIFEDWCGSSTADLRKNMHYPLHPHSRTTVQKLAVSPQWTNYGLRIFGYLHPYTDGEFVFAVSSDDNSEFWLSTDETPPNVQLLAWVGKTGAEWTAPGEFEKYSGQTSRPVRLSAQRRYFFEVIHKQNDNGNDHVEVAWQLLDQDLRFNVIESKHISLYVNESALLLSDIAHIPQTAASYRRTPVKQRRATIDMLREDPRDAFFQVPLINSKFLQGVLPDCQYKPSYTIKDFPLLRYQGLQFVHMSYIYPNDYTRLTHMETQDSCFYPERPYYMKMFGFSRFMKLDRPDTQEKGIAVRDFGFRMRKLVPNDEEDEFENEPIHGEKAAKPEYTIFPDYGDDYDDYAQRRRRKLFSLVKQDTNIKPKNASDIRMRRDESQRRRKKNAGVPQLQPKTQKPPELVQPTPTLKHLLPQRQNRTELKLDVRVADAEQIKPKRRVRPARKQKIKPVRTAVRAEQTNPPVDREHLKAKEREKVLQEHHMQRKTNHTKIQRPKDSKRLPADKAVPLPERPAAAKQRRFVTREAEPPPATNNTRPMTTRRDVDSRMRLREKEIEMNMPLQQDLDSIQRAKISRGNEGRMWPDTKGEEGQTGREEEGKTKEGDTEGLWGLGEDFEGTDDEDLTPAPVFDMEVNWSQTFQVSHLDLQAQRSDWIDLQCNISGNLLLQSSDVGPIVKAFMDQLNKKHNWRFKLVRVINVVKRVDGVQGSRYLLELELKDKNGQLLRLTRYVYALLRYSRQHSRDLGFQQPKPEKLLCNPVGFQWNPTATVHIIVPVKNQARWVQQLITDMEQLFRVTRDTNFNLIITDYNSTDMDVRKALQKSSLPKYQYVKLSGNFERSAGLQAGVDLISDSHSIVFLCDLHIHFPSSIIDTIRKHCVEGHMAFAPIVMRLNCGSTPLEARGFWEVNGFGLLGIYKSDLDALGGMNTREFRERWGGEDWELLDRILQAGLEVERIYLKNFFHYYHSKRGMWNHQMPRSHR